MARTDNHIPLMYVECDIPDGVTLVEWRRDQAAAARARHEEARATRPRRRLRQPALRLRFA
jgi:hypothetical protein